MRVWEGVKLAGMGVFIAQSGKFLVVQKFIYLNLEFIIWVLAPRIWVGAIFNRRHRTDFFFQCFLLILFVVFRIRRWAPYGVEQFVPKIQNMGAICCLINAGRRTDFRDKKSSDFSGEIFRERNYCPRTAFSGSNSWSILSNHVISWYGSRAVGCPIGREITAGTCSLLGNEGTPPDFEPFFLEKRPWKRFSTNVLIWGKWIHSTAN